MKKFYPAIFVLVLAACSLTPEQIAENIVECEYYSLVPVAVVRRDAVRRINCLPPDNIIIIERELQLIKLPELPTIPGRD